VPQHYRVQPDVVVPSSGLVADLPVDLPALPRAVLRRLPRREPLPWVVV